MAVPSVITDLSVVAASNSPAGTDTIGNTLDDFLRGGFAIVRREQAQGAALASASTVNIGGNTDGNYLHITGTTTITSFGTVSAGISRTLVFDGSLTLTHNSTSLILPGAANIVTAAGDVAEFVSEGSGNWRCIRYLPVGASPLNGYAYNINGLSGTFNASTPTTKFDVTATSVTTYGTAGRGRVYTSVGTKTVDISIQGLGGRDQVSAFSAFAEPNLFYVPDGAGGLSVVASLNDFATGPTGYTEFAPIMNHKLNGGAQFYQGALSGDLFTLSSPQQIASGSLGAFPQTFSYQNYIPVGAKSWLGFNSAACNSNGADGTIYQNVSQISTVTLASIIYLPAGKANGHSFSFEFPLNSSRNVYAGYSNITNATGYIQTVYVTGWNMKR